VINLRHEVIGVVESVEPQTSSFTVHGQRVIQSIGKSKFPEVGTTVAVSGFRMNEQTDRKSTRLNSSHQIISYAVFCLKKKKNNVRKSEKRP